MLWTPVGDETRRVVLSLVGDARLVAGVGGALGHIAESAGLDPGAQAELIAAAEQACRETLSRSAARRPSLGVTIERLTDRIEVTIEHRGRLQSAQESATPGPEHLRVDRVLDRSKNGRFRMTLVKYLTRPSAGK